MGKSYPSRELQDEIRGLYLRCGIQPTRSLMNSVRAMTAADGAKLRDMLHTLAAAGERARNLYPDGRRTTARQLNDFVFWHMLAVRREPNAAELAHYMNLNTVEANRATMALRRIVWERQDREGRASAWRIARGMVSRLTFEEL